MGTRSSSIKNNNDNNIETQSSSINNNIFSFRGLKFPDDKTPMYPIFITCQACGAERFTAEEVEKLSSFDLTREEFLEKYSSRFSHVHPMVCFKCEAKKPVNSFEYNLKHSF